MRGNWEATKIGDIAELVTKGTTPTSVGFAFASSGINFVKVESIDLEGRFIPSKFAHIDGECNDALRRSQLMAGDILFSIAGALGRTAIVTSEILPANTNQALAIIRLKDAANILPEFLLYALSPELVQGQIEKQRGGVAQQNLSLAQLKEFTIPLPPADEQLRIIAVLDGVFADLATVIAKIEKSLKSARELFDGYLSSVFEKKGNGWNERELGEVANINYGYTDSASANPIGPKFLRITDIQDNRVDWDAVPYCSIDNQSLPKYQLEHGDIVFARTGATTGKSYLVTLPPKSVFASYLIRVRPESKFLRPAFLNLFFQSRLYWESIKSGVSGSAQGGFNATKLASLTVGFPGLLDEQDVIVEKLESLQRQIHLLERVYKNKLSNVRELRTALLRKAFSGEMTAPSPGVIKEAAE